MNHPTGKYVVNSGFALLAVFVFLLFFSILALGLTLSARDNASISSNHVQQVQAAAAAEAGLAMAKSVLSEMEWTDALRGPNRIWDSDAAVARTYAFRSPLSWNQARRFDLGQARPQANDDGQISWDGVPALTNWPVSDSTRFFVKVTNNLEDPAGPSSDSDDTVIIRSLGLARRPLLRPARNAVFQLEAKVRRDRTFQLPATLVLAGPGANIRWQGDLQWGTLSSGAPAIAVANADGGAPIETALRQSIEGREDHFQGQGVVGSIVNFSSAFSSDRHFQNLLKYGFLTHLLERLPAYAQPLGSLGVSEKPVLVFSKDDSVVQGPVDASGIVVCAGRLTLQGSVKFRGLILVIGRGELVLEGDCSIEGGIFVARLESGFLGMPSLECSARGSATHGASTIERVLKLFPVAEIWNRVITPEIDPP